MRRHSALVCCTVLLIAGSLALKAHAQASAAQAHVAAAKASIAPKAPNAKPSHVYQNLFNELCTENRDIDAMQAQLAWRTGS